LRSTRRVREDRLERREAVEAIRIEAQSTTTLRAQTWTGEQLVYVCPFGDGGDSGPALRIFDDLRQSFSTHAMFKHSSVTAALALWTMGTYICSYDVYI
jgi:hypothetical protein